MARSPSDYFRSEVDRFDAALPIERAWMPPSSWYTDDEFYAVEKTSVFARSWQPVARVADLGEPGTYVSGCLAGMPWVVVRNHAGELAAFHNVCSHKGREVVTGSGRSDALVCGYHAWRYDFDGRLAKAPRIAGIEEFDRAAMSLTPMAVEEWGPWVFVHGDAAAGPLGAGLAGLHGMLEGGGWGQLSYAGSKDWVIGCNWKVYMDNYLDGGYHIPHMHPTLDAQLDMSSYRTDLFDAYSVQTSGAAAEGDEGLGLDPGTRIGDGAIYAWLYPNFMINRYGPCMDTNYVIPMGTDRCRVVYEFYFDEAAISDLSDFTERSIEQADITQREDIEICESVQIGLSSPTYDRGRYAPRLEQAEHHFHRLICDAYQTHLGRTDAR